MFLSQSYGSLLILRRKMVMLTIGLLLFSGTVIIDLVSSCIQGSFFFLSESMLFAAYWLLFLPGLIVQKLLSGTGAGIWRQASCILAITFCQLALYPLLIDALAWFFLGHGFQYVQTLLYGLGSYPLITGLIYGIDLACTIRSVPSAGAAVGEPVVAEVGPDSAEDASESLRQVPVDLLAPSQHLPANTSSPVLPSFSNTILVTHKHQRINISVREIAYFSVSSPYLTIHHLQDKYLIPGTLKSLVARLDPVLFLRIHRSTLVNISEVTAYRSRLNGDYDLTLRDKTVLRVSRMFAADFKSAFAGMQVSTRPGNMN